MEYLDEVKRLRELMENIKDSSSILEANSIIVGQGNTLNDVERNAFISQAISNVEHGNNENKYLDEAFIAVYKSVDALKHLTDTDIQDEILNKLKNVYGDKNDFSNYQKFVGYLEKMLKYKYKEFRIKVNRNLTEVIIDYKRPTFEDTIYFD